MIYKLREYQGKYNDMNKFNDSVTFVIVFGGSNLRVLEERFESLRKEGVPITS